MSSRSKTNNFVALLIAALLFATGFALYFAHQQLESKKQVKQTLVPESTVTASIVNLAARPGKGNSTRQA